MVITKLSPVHTAPAVPTGKVGDAGSFRVNVIILDVHCGEEVDWTPTIYVPPPKVFILNIPRVSVFTSAPLAGVPVRVPVRIKLYSVLGRRPVI